MKPKEEAGVIATNNSVLQGLVLRASWALPEQCTGVVRLFMPHRSLRCAGTLGDATFCHYDDVVACVGLLDSGSKVAS